MTLFRFLWHCSNLVETSKNKRKVGPYFFSRIPDISTGSCFFMLSMFFRAVIFEVMATLGDSLKCPDHGFSTLTSALGTVVRTYRRVVHSCLRCCESYCAASETAPPAAVRTSESLHAPARESVVQSKDACSATASLTVHPSAKALHHSSIFLWCQVA